MEPPSEDIEKQVYAEALRKAAHDYEELVQEFSVLRMLNDSIQVGLNFAEICRNLVQFVTEMMNVENASIMVFDKKKKELQLLVAKGILDENGTVYTDHPWSGKAFKLGEGIAGKAAADRKSILINDTLNDARFVRNEGQKVRVRSILSIPLIHEDRIHGVLNISNSTPNAFTRKKEHALTVIASTASVAMSYALAVEQLRTINSELHDRNKELAAVIGLSEFLHTGLDLDAVLEKSLQTIMEAFDVDGAAIFLAEEPDPTSVLRACKSLKIKDLNGLFTLLNERYGEILAAANHPMVRSWLSDETIETQYPFARQMHFVGIPLYSGNLCSGSLMTARFKGQEFRETEVKLLRSFCNQIEMAIHNCKLILRLQQNIDELQETRRKLIQADKLALLGEMLSGVAHEINNPLAAIQGYSELLLEEESLAAKQARILEKITLCVDRTRKIVQGLLSFARRTELQKRRVHIHDLIDRALQHREHEFNIHGIEIVRNLDTGNPAALVDANQIEQIFLNLINNAYDSMAAKGEGKLIIDTVVDSGTVRIGFADTGVGIPRKNRQKIFEPFFTTKEAGKGTGLGLSISYGIAKEHGGNLFVDEHYESGAKLVIELPAAPDEKPDEHGNLKNDAFERIRPEDRMLVVDDEEVVLDFLSSALSAEGFMVECASSGEAASSLLREESFALVISDIKMPGPIDGPRLFRLCREENPRQAERFIFITGDIIESATSQFLEESRRPFLLKPFTIRDLRQMVYQTLRTVSRKDG